MAGGLIEVELGAKVPRVGEFATISVTLNSAAFFQLVLSSTKAGVRADSTGLVSGPVSNSIVGVRYCLPYLNFPTATSVRGGDSRVRLSVETNGLDIAEVRLSGLHFFQSSVRPYPLSLSAVRSSVATTGSFATVVLDVRNLNPTRVDVLDSGIDVPPGVSVRPLEHRSFSLAPGRIRRLRFRLESSMDGRFEAVGFIRGRLSRPRVRVSVQFLAKSGNKITPLVWGALGGVGGLLIGFGVLRARGHRRS